MPVLFSTRVRLQAEPELELRALADGMEGQWTIESVPGEACWQARREDEGRTAVLELAVRERDHKLELSTHPVVNLNSGSALVGVAGGLCVAAAVGSGIYVIVPLGFQLALPVAIFVFLGSSFGLAVSVPILLDKLRGPEGDQALAAGLRELLAASQTLTIV